VPWSATDLPVPVIDREPLGHEAFLLSPAALQALIHFLHDRSEPISTDRRD
jgi:hypothetical protein